MRILRAVCSMQNKFTAQRVTQVSFFEVITSKKSRGRQWIFIMLCLARVVRQFPAQYFGKLPGFNLWKLTRLSGVFFPVCRPFFEAGAGRWSKITSFMKFDWSVIFSSRSKSTSYEFRAWRGKMYVLQIYLVTTKTSVDLRSPSSSSSVINTTLQRIHLTNVSARAAAPRF